MMYPFLTLDDSTEIVHSQTLQDGNVKVYIEKPDEKDGSTMLPASCRNIGGQISLDSLTRIFRNIRRSLNRLHICLCALPQEGGLENAAGF